ncbi:MAG: insulinase family protein [Myxococcota bacterium]
MHRLIPSSLGISLLCACPARVEPTPPVANDPAILDASDLPPLQPTPLADDPLGVTVHRLSNGMTVYISPNPEQPRVTAWVVVRAGSRHDPADSTGLAHYLEHMLFKGTDELGTLDIEREQPHLDRIAQLYDALREPGADTANLFAQIDQQTQKSAEYSIPNEQSRLYGAIGITGTNAFTSYDCTAYIADVPANRLEIWAEVEAERFADARFRLFLPELESVYEEKNIDLDDPDEREREVLAQALYPHHPYGQQLILGDIEHLKLPAYGDMVAFFEQWYAPNNMAILLAGDVTPQVVPLLEASFGRLEPRALPERPQGDLTGPQRRVEVPFLADGTRGVQLAWRTIPATDADVPALIVLDRLLDSARSGLLNVDLELPGKLPAAGSYVTHRAEAGHLAVWALARDDQPLDEVETLLRGVVARVKAGDFAPEGLEAIKLGDEISRKYALESNPARVNQMLNAFVQGRPWIDAVQDERRLAEVTSEQIVEVARRYLGDDMVVLRREKGELPIPELTKPSITPVKIDHRRQSPYARTQQERPVPPLQPRALKHGEHFERRVTASGPLLSTRNPYHDLFAVRYEVDRGLRREPLLCHAISLWELAGTEDTAAAELREQLHRLGTWVRTECGADQSALVITGIDRNLEASLTLVRRWLEAPRVDAAAAKQHRDNTLSLRRDHLEDPQLLDWALWNYAAYGERSEALNEPSNAAVAAADPTALLALVSTWLDHTHRTLYFGPRPSAELEDLLVLGKDHVATAPVEPRRFRTAEGTQLILVHREMAKASVSVVVPIPARPPQERPLAVGLDEYFSGESTALFYQEIREARGLAYNANGGYLLGKRPGDDEGLYALLETQADKVPEALRMALTLLRAPLRDELVQAASTSLDQRVRAERISPRDVPRQIAAWDARGLREDPRLRDWEVYKRLTPAMLEELLESTRQAPRVIAILGDRERIDRKALEAAYGPIVEVEPQALFSYEPAR